MTQMTFIKGEEMLDLDSVYVASYPHIESWSQHIVFILACEHGKFYCGKTQWLESEIRELAHNGLGHWTNLHRPTKLHYAKIVEGYDYDDGNSKASRFVNKLTCGLMKRFGIDNVRGGIWIHPEIKARKSLEDIST